MDNLSITQPCDTLCYARICNGGYRPQLQRFLHREYVNLYREAPTTLDVSARRTIFQMKEVLPSSLLLLEG